MTNQEFVHFHSPTLAKHAKELLLNQIDVEQYHQYYWLLLAQWQQLNLVSNQTPQNQENVFWHLLFELDHWSIEQLRGNHSLKQHLLACCDFIQGDGPMPSNCIGLAPAFIFDDSLE